jgi:hypothetical protein
VLVGCPTANREWIIAQWLDHIVRAASVANVGIEVVLVGPPHDRTSLTARDRADALDVPLHWFDSCEQVGDHARDMADLGGDEHLWPDQRLKKLVCLRNRLLELVRSKRPELFLSIDSDVLLHERALVQMMDLLSDMRYAAVGSKVQLSPFSLDAPSYACLTEDGRLHRSNLSTVLEVDAIMAVKLMRRCAYDVDYVFDPRGEDIGWSVMCKRRGLTLAWDGRVTSEHVMLRRRTR